MSLLCQSQQYYFGNSGSGYSLMTSNIYSTDTGGSVPSGYYCDGTYVYTVVENFGVSTITNVETAAELGCGGLTPPPSPSPIPQGTLYNFAFHSTSSETACSFAI